MSLPAGTTEPFDADRQFRITLAEAVDAPEAMELRVAPTGAGGLPGVVALWSEAVVRDLNPSGLLTPLLAGMNAGALLATAGCEGRDYDFVSRFFAPGMGVPEDPVTGSMHATLAPFWAARLGKNELRAFQASPRGGELGCVVAAGRVILSGPCALYLRGET